MFFFVGLHMPNHARYFDHCFISINRLESRKSNFAVKDWILDSGAFTRISTGVGHMPIKEYAMHIQRWKKCGNLLAAVCQDYMCEPFILSKTGLCVGDHQVMTTKNYRLLSMAKTGVYIMPVLQGYAPQEYVEHIRVYGNALQVNAWCGVGSVCKRNSDVGQIWSILNAIKTRRPDLRLHGFGLKQTALKHNSIRKMLYSADSMAWSFAARKSNRNANDPNEAMTFSTDINSGPSQFELFNQPATDRNGERK
jgi:hypothetical protein